MVPFTEGPSSFKTEEESTYESKLSDELKRRGYANPDAKMLREEATKIISDCGHNVGRMTDRLSKLLARKSNLREAIADVYIRSLYKVLHPAGGALVDASIRGGQTVSDGPTSEPVTSREPPTKFGRPPKALPPVPGIGTRKIGAATAAIEKLFLTRDGKDIRTISYSELVARHRESGEDYHRYGTLLARIGSPPIDTSVAIGTLLKDDVFASVM